MEIKSGYIPVSVDETCTERIYSWQINNNKLNIISRQLPGKNISELELDYSGLRSNRQYILKWGEDSLLQNSYTFINTSSNKIFLTGLEPRGKRYFFNIYEKAVDNEKAIIPTLSFRTIIRYPYGRTFKDNYKNLTQRFGQDPVIGYDLKYYSNDDSLDGVKMFLGDTSISGYIDHIISSITTTEMGKMQKAIEIGKFLGSAIHHNPIHINLKETVRAIDEFVEKGWEKADIDNEAIWLMELGHTRCGVINGFLSTAFLRRVGIQNEVFYGCGGHTTGRVFIDGAWRLWDVDAFKGVMPLDPDGNLPSLEWLGSGKNVFLLDTCPSWDDSRPDEGWLKTYDGRRITGYTGGGRYHSETGYGSSFIGGPKEYPPSVPILLPVRKRKGNSVLLEWIGSYDRDNDFKDYVVDIMDAEQNIPIMQFETKDTYCECELPYLDKKYTWTVRARDYHARGTIYEDKIVYTKPVPAALPVKDIDLDRYFWDFLCTDEIEGRESIVTTDDKHDFIRVEGFDDFLGQTNYCKTELWKLQAGKYNKRIYRLVDESNCWFNGCHIRSLWKKKLDAERKNKDGWHFTSILYIDKYSMAGKAKFPVLWTGRDRSYLGFGLIIDPDKGLIFTGSNIFGDWRCGKGFEPRGWFRFDIVNIAGEKTVNYYLDGELLCKEDSNIFREETFDVDTVYVSSNPEAELDFMIGDILI